MWINGKADQALRPEDRAINYGDGLFETIRIQSHTPTLFDAHMQRLKLGAQRLGIALDLNLLRREISDFLSLQSSCGVLKVLLSRGAGGRGYNPAACEQSLRLLNFFQLPEYPSENAQGIKLYPCVTPLGHSPALAGMKHLNRLEQVLARAEWQDPSFAEGLMLDIRGRVVEGTMSNLFLVKGGQLLTADLSLCGVAGVCRERIIELAAERGIDICIRDISENELLQADEVFVCNSVFGVWPVAAYKDRHWKVGPLSLKIQAWLQQELVL